MIVRIVNFSFYIILFFLYYFCLEVEIERFFHVLFANSKKEKSNFKANVKATTKTICLNKKIRVEISRNSSKCNYFPTNNLFKQFYIFSLFLAYCNLKKTVLQLPFETSTFSFSCRGYHLNPKI